jgi:hypothetical protein
MFILMEQFSPYNVIYTLLAEVPGVARESSILIYTCKTPIGLENI